MYLNFAQFRTATIMPGEDVDYVAGAAPGFIEARIAHHESRINARLAKRYAVPFDAASPPTIVRDWLVALVTLDAYAKRGFNPEGASDAAAIVEPAKAAIAELLEAADAEDGRFELPIRQDSPAATGASTRGAPVSYSEVSPYTACDVQIEAIRGGRR